MVFAVLVRAAGRSLAYVVVGFLLLVAAGWGLGALLDVGAARDGSALFDRPAVRFFAAHRGPPADGAMKTITFLGSTAFVATALAVSAAGAYAVTRNSRWPLFFSGALVGGLLLSRIVKSLVERPRPDIDPLIDIGGYAWPSGHATAASTAFLAIAYFVTRRAAGATGKAIWGVAVVVTAAVCLSRVYLGVHWPTDVMGGFALGAVWVAIVAAATTPEPAGEAPDS